jgi:epsilon-lactone hydrolase
MNNAGANSDPPPTRPSLRGRIATRLVRVVVKRWARGDPPAVVRRARRVFGLPNFMNALHSRDLEIEKVDAQAADSDVIRGEWIRLKACESRERVLLYLHGGGYVSCSPQTHRAITTALARRLKCPVFALDYRLAPEHPFPAAVDDAAAAFAWLTESGLAPEKIALAGDSAGGGLALATIVRLRALGRALPACAVGLSPWVNLTGAGEYRNSGSCSMFQPSDVAVFAKLYLDGASAESAEASPLFADLRGIPPLLTQVSSTELLFDDAMCLHEKATSCGVTSTLRVYPGLPHVWQILVGLVPEAGVGLDEIADFVLSTWSASSLHPNTDGDRNTNAPTNASAASSYNRETS